MGGLDMSPVKRTTVGEGLSQKFTISYTGSAAEFALTLARGANQYITSVDVLSGSAPPASYFIATRKDTASSANERNITHADSYGVFIGEQYLDNGPTLIPYDQQSQSLKLRLYVDLGPESHTAYVKVTYIPSA